MGADDRTKTCNSGPKVDSVLKLDNSICWQNQKNESQKVCGVYFCVVCVFWLMKSLKIVDAN